MYGTLRAATWRMAALEGFCKPALQDYTDFGHVNSEKGGPPTGKIDELRLAKSSW